MHQVLESCTVLRNGSLYLQRLCHHLFWRCIQSVQESWKQQVQAFHHLRLPSFHVWWLSISIQYCVHLDNQWLPGSFPTTTQSLFAIMTSRIAFFRVCLGQKYIITWEPEADILLDPPSFLQSLSGFESLHFAIGMRISIFPFNRKSHMMLWMRECVQWNMIAWRDWSSSAELLDGWLLDGFLTLH